MLNIDTASFSDLCQGPFAHIRVIPKTRLYESWRVAWVRRTEELRVDVPLVLVEAPVAVKESLLQWAVLVSQRKNRRDVGLRTRRADLENQIREYLRSPQSEGGKPTRAVEMRQARNHRREARLNSKGRHHDLQAGFLAVNARYFQGALKAKLTWSARIGGLSTHSLAQDGNGNPYHLISISQGYDSAEVTPEILEGVIYHECLHIAIPPRRENGRRVVHGSDFKLREREYAYFDAWRQWHREGLPKALRRLRKA